MNHDHHMMGHGSHGMVDDTTTTHDHGSMTTASAGAAPVHDHSASVASSSHNMMMQMYFEAGYQATVLFKEWDIQTVGAMVGSCIGIFFLGILYEGLKFFREWLHRRNYMAIDYSKVTAPQGNGVQVNQTKRVVSFKTSITSGPHYIQTALHIVQLILSYFLMLIVMTYNVWLFISVVLGCTVGYFLFGWQKGFLVDITEHCH